MSNTLLNLIGLSLFTAGFALFLQMCYLPGHVFHRWYLLLQTVYIRSWGRKDRWKRHLTKPLGLCPYCQTVWFHSFFFVVLTDAGLWWWMLSVGVNYLWLELLLKIVPSHEAEPFERTVPKPIISDENLEKLARHAGRPIGEAKRAVADASIGEFQRLKEFGVMTVKSGEFAYLTLAGNYATCELEPVAIQKALLALIVPLPWTVVIHRA